MTSTTDMAGHPDVAEISDLTEGLLPPSRTADIRQHLTECEFCADVHASLEEIRGLLGTFPGPPGMPGEIAGRIDAALAAEALLDATVPEAEDSLAAASRSLTDADDDIDVSRETSTPSQRPSGRARVSTTGPGRKDRKRAGRRRVAILGSVFAVAALGLGTVLVATLGDGKPSSPEAGGRHTTAADTFSQTNLGKQVSELLAKEQSSGQVSSAPHSSVGVQGNPGIMSPKIDRTPSVPPCILNGIGRNDSALATEEGTYKGTHALLVVLSDPSDSTKVNAYIVDATCVTHPSSAKAKVLLTQSYTRQQG